MELIKPLETSFIAPDGLQLTIRETNGEDESVLSKVANTNDNSSFPKFVSNICTSVNGDRKPTVAEVSNWKAKNVYYTLLKSRLHSLGKEVTFRLNCSEPSCTYCRTKHPITFEEDLSTYDWDLSKAPPTKDEPGYSKVRISPYPTSNEHHTFTVASGRKYRFKYKTFALELKGLALPQDTIDINTPLVLRELEIESASGWSKVLHFLAIPSREMSEIRKEVQEQDPDWDATSEATCPGCGTIYRTNIFTQPNFFFPGMTT